ncbi:MAG: RDD family protein [Candidatus Moraniibacteriota bacterium]
MEEQNLNNVGGVSQSPIIGNVSETSAQPIENPSIPVPTQVRYAGFWIRFAASFVDGIVIFFISIPFVILAFLSMGGEIKNSFSVNILSFLISWGYHILMTDKYQATLGKKFVGIKVVKEDLSRASLGNLVLRETAGKFLSQLILLIGYIMAAFTSRKRALHDIIGGTVVIFDDKNVKSRKLIIGVITAIVGFFVIMLLFVASITLISLQSAREKAQEKVEESRQQSQTQEIDIEEN